MKNNYSDVGAIVLAAGKGSRMKSDLPKVLHEINGQSMIYSVLSCAVSLLGRQVVVVVGHAAALVQKSVSRDFDVLFARQEALLGTGDAVKSALPVLPRKVAHVLVLCGDVPMIQPRTLAGLIEFHRREQNDVSVLSVHLENPTGYGRVILDKNNQLTCIREEVDATDAERKNTRINSGIYCINKEFLIDAIEGIDCDNAQQEYYLTDIVKIAVSRGGKAGSLSGHSAVEVMGVNTPADLHRVACCMAEKPNELS
ncbi:bifunctional UDP-N-acetylglucosamine pyrophosphorylase / Glucosamine-1-phosphate N-acetyltransferase/UDP-N-acetylglucosamine pyrophosphorylase [Desulfocicer vacuolatum DSM 3385]|uniref:Bifunctional UDP-N-acetylglucosamine pyrophosphorylase / Glucosamine-1-phosphate N-acetyltransferase/UDP-N-acetylglucosamine pyrophosphorylase n=1 Tax=Desulfocicer vacuolatum DSM 3385 TaxID=1121400 RepID=A0A1W1YZC6_9BACT|nr:NTP transferase domain-containing protein [Desulfocicer vacuolatum]SMC41486.1 bifunctional UDP-N-acetylglucosamine pyrophosphorylase / Glucosamine-1-phosphate N-acetyltransferase/UDP-N-acetylglucosamine pyrophosphorylase [Desulfocicer vacuolatum DSM 3385]